MQYVLFGLVVLCVGVGISVVYADLTDYMDHSWPIVVFDTFLEYDGCPTLCFFITDEHNKSAKRTIEFTEYWLGEDIIPFYLTDGLNSPSPGWRVVLDDCRISLFGGGHTAYVDFNERNMKFCAGYIDTMISEYDQYNQKYIVGAFDVIWLHEFSHIIMDQDFTAIYDNDELNTDLMALYIIYRQFEHVTGLTTEREQELEQISGGLGIIQLMMLDRMEDLNEEYEDVHGSEIPDRDVEKLQRYLVTTCAIDLFMDHLHRNGMFTNDGHDIAELIFINVNSVGSCDDWYGDIVKTFQVYDLLLGVDIIEPKETNWKFMLQH